MGLESDIETTKTTLARLEGRLSAKPSKKSKRGGGEGARGAGTPENWEDLVQNDLSGKIAPYTDLSYGR